MARLEGIDDLPASDPNSRQALGAATVKQLAEVGRKLYPLREKRASGKKLTKRQSETWEALESEYRELERDLHELMRPRQQDPWLQGRGHAH